MSPTSLAIRQQIEATLAKRIPSSLTPALRIIRPVASTGIRTIDEVLEGGLPVGAITEIVGAECSGRTSLSLSFLSHLTHTAKDCPLSTFSHCRLPNHPAPPAL